MVKLLSDICLNMIQVSLDKVPTIGQYLPTLYKEKLIERLSWHDMLQPSYVCHVSKQLFSPYLRRINFYKCDQVNDSLLSLLEASKCRLEYLTINRCQNVSDQGILSCTRNQNELISITIRKNRTVTDACLTCIKSDKLKHLDLSDCSKITFSGVMRIAEKNRSLEELYVRGICEVISKEWLKNKPSVHLHNYHSHITKIANCLTDNLQVLDTALNQLCDECLTTVAAHCPNIKKLNIHGSSRITGEALTKFCIGCPSLEVLDLSYCSSLCTGTSMESFWTLPTSLVELSLTGLLFADETIFVECLQRLHRLKYIKLCGVSALNDNTLKQVLQYIGSNLLSLDISGGLAEGLTDDGLAAIPQYCDNLEILVVKMLPKITCISLLPLFKDKEKAEKLRKLYLSTLLNPDVLDEVVKSCCHLEKLDLSGVQCVTDDTLCTLATNCPKLAEFGIKSCRQDCSIPRLFYQHITPNAQPNQLMARNLDTGEFCRADLLETLEIPAR